MKPPPFTGRGLHCVYPQVMIVRAVIQSPDGDRRDLEVVAASFEQGCAELDELRPAGWREVAIIVEHGTVGGR